MDTFYTYVITGDTISDDIEDMIKKTSSLTLSILYDNTNIGVSFLYDNEENLLHEDSFSGVNSPIFGKPITIEYLREILKSSSSSLTIKTKEKCDRESTIQIVNNYSQMITDLEKLGIISTQNTNSFWAEDNRSFHFNKGFLVEDYNEWAVDCLGTTFCKDITFLVENAWKKYISI